MATDSAAETEYLTAIATGRVGTGLSSKALALYGLGLNDGLRDHMGFAARPHDPSDLRRCFEAFEAAPLHIQNVMLPVLREWTAAVFAKYPEPKGSPQEVAAYMEQAARIAEWPSMASASARPDGGSE